MESALHGIFALVVLEISLRGTLGFTVLRY